MDQQLQTGADLTTEEKLRQLGDPSGHQSAEYWNAWFDAVCYGNGRGENSDVRKDSRRETFEWYCDAHEVARILEYHMPTATTDSAQPTTDRPRRHRRRKIVHPGSGNSSVPTTLRDVYSYPYHSVVDVSDVAIREICRLEQGRLDDTVAGSSDAATTAAEPIDYTVGDVLSPPLPYDDGEFDVWIDKGLIDALFSGADGDEEKCECLFREAHRMLRPGGCVVVVSMAEAHSLRLIVSNWGVSEKGRARRWKGMMDVWELVPTSGTMRPFGFVLTKEALSEEEEGITEDVEENGVCNRAATFHGLDGSTETAKFVAETDSSVLREVEEILDRSREAFAKENVVAVGRLEGAHATLAGTPAHDVDGNGSSSHMESQRYVRALIEVKPYDAEVNLQEIATRITTVGWESADGRVFEPRWQRQNEAEDSDNGDNMPTRPAPYGTIVPIGYGISKLVLNCIVDSEDLEGICESILETLGEKEELVQSVDVDWDNTIPVGDAKCLLGQGRKKDAE